MCVFGPTEDRLQNDGLPTIQYIFYFLLSFFSSSSPLPYTLFPSPVHPLPHSCHLSGPSWSFWSRRVCRRRYYERSTIYWVFEVSTHPNGNTEEPGGSSLSQDKPLRPYLAFGPFLDHLWVRPEGVHRTRVLYLYNMFLRSTDRG